jgi:hypothetical protein
MDTWLDELVVLPQPSFRQASRIIPPLHRKIVALSLLEGSDHGSSGDIEMDSPVKLAVGSGPVEAVGTAEILTTPKVSTPPPVASAYLLNQGQCDNCDRHKHQCWVKEGAARWSKCEKCRSQKKGCYWTKAKAQDDKEKPSEVVATGEKSMGGAPTVSVASEKGPTIRARPAKGKGVKRKKEDESPERPVASQASTSHTPRAEVVLPPPRPRPTRSRVRGTPSTSPLHTFTVVDLPPPASPSASSTLLEPPPSATSTSSAYSQPSSLEVAILRTQLHAAQDTLRRERDRFQQELQAQKEQFDREREMYKEYISNLEQGGRQ